MARLEDTFQPSTPLRVPVEYTGFVLGHTNTGATSPSRTRRITVSAGGGLVGEPLFAAAVAAQPLLWHVDRVEMNIVAGPFLPEPAWFRLRQQAAGRPGLHVRRFVPDLRGQLQRAAGSVSQCGYNTALDILASRAPGLVVPYTTPSEDEQLRRARRLEASARCACSRPISSMARPSFARCARSCTSAPRVWRST